MIRVLMLAIAVCLATIGGVYGAVLLKSDPSKKPEKEDTTKLQIMKTRMVSVPILADGEVLGYVVTRLQFTVDGDSLKGRSLQPEPFVADEAFRIIYENGAGDIKNGRRQVVKELTAKIAEAVNNRLGAHIVHDALIDSWTYLSKQDMIQNNDRVRR